MKCKVQSGDIQDDAEHTHKKSTTPLGPAAYVFSRCYSCECVWLIWSRLFISVGRRGRLWFQISRHDQSVKLCTLRPLANVVYHVRIEQDDRALSFTEALMSNLSCTKTLVILGWLHTWGTPNRTQAQGMRRTSEPAIGNVV